MFHSHNLKLQVVGLVLLLLAGCGGGRRSVSGTVTFQGQPLDQGSIQFFAKAGPPGPSGGAMIRNGKYALTGDHGLDTGTYTIKITSAGPPQAAGEIKMGDFPVTQERIPAGYNTESTRTVVVAPSGANTFDFAVD